VQRLKLDVTTIAPIHGVGGDIDDRDTAVGSCIQIVPDGSRAYVAAEGDDNVAVIDLRTLEITNRLTFPTRSRPDGMAWAGLK
jgi:YVTN family beta-propeller protein